MGVIQARYVAEREIQCWWRKLYMVPWGREQKPLAWIFRPMLWSGDLISETVVGLGHDRRAA